MPFVGHRLPRAQHAIYGGRAPPPRPARPRTLAGFTAKAPKFENSSSPYKEGVASIAFEDRRRSPHPLVVYFRSESPSMVQAYKYGASYLRTDVKSENERTLMWGKRRALGTEVGPQQWSIETLVADRYVARVSCPFPLDECSKLIQQIDLDKLEAVK